MTGVVSAFGAKAPEPPEIDVTVAHPARMYDYYLNGRTHFAADREAAEKVLAVLPEGRDMATANRAFLGRAVRFLAGNGISQFLDIGTGIPSPGSTSEVLRDMRHESRVVYVDNDPIVVAHARARIVRQLKDAVPRGSYLAISHGTQDFSPERATAAVRGYERATAPFVLRSRERVEGFFDGLRLVDPGVGSRAGTAVTWGPCGK